MRRIAVWRLGRAGRIVGWILLPASVALQRLAPPQAVESLYVRRLYPPIAGILSRGNSLVGFSIAEALVLLLLAVGAIALVWVLSPGARRRRLAAIGTWLPPLVGYALFAFVALWGLCYDRPPMARRMRLSPGGTTEELVKTASWLASETARLAPPPAPPPAGGPGGGGRSRPTRLPWSRDVLNTRIEDAYARAARLRLGAPGPLGPAKPVFFSGLLARLGLSGIYVAYTGEPNYNRLIPDAELPFAVAHEKAHQRGIARENEANFAAFLVLDASREPYLRYCGYLGAADYALAAVRRAAPNSFAGTCRLLDGRPAADLAAMAAFWRRYRGPMRRVSQRVNDLYLRANRVPGGIRSYDAVTDLLVGYYRRRVARAE